MTRSRRLRLLGAGALLGTLFIVAVAPVIGGTGAGAVFNLGRTNAVNKASVLTGKSASRILQVTNSGSGTALQLTTKTTVPPMKVSSSVKVSNLNADKLDGLDSTGFLQPSGQILISAGNGGWVPFNSTDPVSQIYFSSTVQWTRSAIGSGFLSVSPDLPTAMFGKMLQLEGVEFCFGPMPGTSLKYVEINTISSTAGESARSLKFSDPTTYTDPACHLYTLPTPAPLGSETSANFFVQVNWAVAASAFAINRTTFVLGMTDTPAPAPAAVVITGDPVKPGARSITDVPTK
jgi:hypothetical protein